MLNVRTDFVSAGSRVETNTHRVVVTLRSFLPYLALNVLDNFHILCIP